MNSLHFPDVASAMPDIASQALEQPQDTLDWVGMANVHQPFRLRENGLEIRVHGNAHVFVDLADPEAKGIHMSRLYLLLQRYAADEVLSVASLRRILEELRISHEELSTRALLEVGFDHFVRRQALKSDNEGWSSYPVRVRAQWLDGAPRVELSVAVTYSSTCPCSAALARQLIQQQFQRDFEGQSQVDPAAMLEWLGSERGIVATPHSQRSVAEVLVQLDDQLDELPITELIDLVEGVLKTPVQAAVKREDEQEFALLNGRNLMFCEDASRRIKAALGRAPAVQDFWLRVNHYESLHGHDAVAVATAGRPGGYQPIL